ncbi:MAG: M56 family metallopeptidase [Planctomycetota bacterium]
MTALVDALRALAEHGPTVLVGVTLVLLFGTLAMALHRCPSLRRQIGVATALGALLYLLVGLAPLPRLTWRAESIPTSAPYTAASFAPLPDADARAAMLLEAMTALTTKAPADGGLATPSLELPAPPAAMPMPASAPPVSTAAATQRWLGSVFAWPWPFLLVCAYVLGAAFTLLRSIAGCLRLGRVLATCRLVPQPILRGIHLPRGTRVYSTAAQVRPFCAGLWRPIVVLPRDLLAPERRAEVLAVMHHEAAHLRAGDSRVQALLAWLTVPLFCHPLFWWLCRDVRFCSELLADDAAAQASGRNDYARALIDLAERDQPQLIAAGTVAVFHRPSEFYRRIQMLLQREGSLSTSTSRLRRFTHAFATLCLVGTAASLFGVPATAQDPERGALHQRNAELRETIETLRAELRDLRRQIQELHADQGQQPTPPPTARRTIREVLRDGQWTDDMGALLRAREALGDAGYVSGQLQLDNQALDYTRIVGGYQKALDLLQSTTQGPAKPPGQSTAPDGVPLLGDLPVIGSLFQNRAEATTPAPAAVPLVSDLSVFFNDAEATTPAPSSAVEAQPTYTVKKGDTLDLIAHRELGDPRLAPELLRCNPGIEPQRLRIGQKLALPPSAATAPELPATVNLDSLLGRRSEVRAANTPPSAEMPAPPAAAPAPTGAAALADLTSRYLDLQAEIEIAEITAAETQLLAGAGQATQREAKQAAVNLRNLHKKFAIAQRLVDGEITATEQELAWVEQKRINSSPTEALQLDMQASRARTRLEALRSVK